MTNSNTPQMVLTFDSQDDYLQLPEMEFDFSRGLSVEAWVYCASYKKNSRVIDFGNGNTNNIVLSFYQGLVPMFLIYKGHQPEGALYSKEKIERENWFHLAVTIDISGTGKLYQNGIQISSKQMLLPQNIQRINNYIGKSNFDGNELFHGLLSEIRIWNVARSEAEIAGNMHHRLVGNELGLVGYWPLDEGSGTITHDKTQNNHHGTIHGGATWEQTELPITSPDNQLIIDPPVEPIVTIDPPEITKPTVDPPEISEKNLKMSNSQSLLTFNGTSDYISVPDSLSLQISPYTVEVWMKPTGSKTAGSRGAWSAMWRGILGKPGRNFHIWLRASGQIHHRFHTDKDWNHGISDTPNDSIKWLQWNHVAITNDGNTAKTYINGELQVEGETEGTLIIDKTPLYIATADLDGKGELPQYCDYFKGKLADIRIWNMARSPEEINSLMDKQLQGNEPGLVAYWPLNQGSGTTATDGTGNGNSGTIHGGTWEQEEVNFFQPITTTPTEPSITDPNKITVDPTPPTTKEPNVVTPKPIVDPTPTTIPTTPMTKKPTTTTKVTVAEGQSLGTGLEDYGYWYRWKQSLPKQTDSKTFRRGRIWT